MKNIKIISDGTSEGTHVFDSDGHEIKGINYIKIDINTWGGVSAFLEFRNAKLEITSHNLDIRDNIINENNSHWNNE